MKPTGWEFLEFPTARRRGKGWSGGEAREGADRCCYSLTSYTVLLQERHFKSLPSKLLSYNRTSGTASKSFDFEGSDCLFCMWPAMCAAPAIPSQRILTYTIKLNAQKCETWRATVCSLAASRWLEHNTRSHPHLETLLP